MALFWKEDVWLVDRLATQDDLEKEKNFHAFRESARGVDKSKKDDADGLSPKEKQVAKLDIVASVLYDMSSLNDKAAALLQFIAITTAALAAALSFNPWEKHQFFIGSLLGVFLLLAFALLRCLNIMAPNHMAFSSPNSYLEQARKELVVRRKIFVWVLRFAMISTLVAAVGLFIRIMFPV